MIPHKLSIHDGIKVGTFREIVMKGNIDIDTHRIKGEGVDLVGGTGGWYSYNQGTTNVRDFYGRTLQGTRSGGEGLKLGSSATYLGILNGRTKRTITPSTLGAGATTFAITGEAMIITGDGGGNTIATITGGIDGQFLILIFVDANVTITDDNTHGADTVDLSGAFTSADDTMLILWYDGTSWYEVSRSVN